MGLLIGMGNNKPAWPYDNYYGVEWDTSASTTALTRIGKTTLHVSLPIQNRMRRCLLADDGHVVTYLGANDSTKTDTGASADLSGASGQVMVEIPEHWRKFEADGTKWRCLISEIQLPGFHKVPKMYRSAYQAALDRTNNKLASVVNTTAQYRGGNNTSGWDDTYRSLLGMPATNISLTNFRTYAGNRGTGWCCDVYAAQKATYWLYTVEYANFNCQAAYNAQPDANGFKQGGLGPGVSQMTSWDTYNSYNPFIPCGVTNSLGNRTGVVTHNVLASDGETTHYAASVPSYRGIENPFGHVWSWMDGCLASIESGDSGKSSFYTCDDPSKFSSTITSDYVKRGELARASGWFKTMMVGEYGENMCTAIGGSSSTYMADYFYTSIPASGTETRGLLFGGRANGDADDGLAYAYSAYTPSGASAAVGSRLCFIPAA